MAARIVEPREKWHRLRIRSDCDEGELLIVGTGRNAYLWASKDRGECVTFSGQQTLRKLAKAILANVPERKRK